jgi:signal transduction histidine kinase
VAVSDTDIGIAQQDREEVFEASSTASRQGIELQSVLPQRSSLAP